jgi:hypothetical protein
VSLMMSDLTVWQSVGEWMKRHRDESTKCGLLVGY